MRLEMNHQANQWKDWRVDKHEADDEEAGVLVTLVPVDDSIEGNVCRFTLSESEAQSFPVNTQVVVEITVKK